MSKKVNLLRRSTLQFWSKNFIHRHYHKRVEQVTRQPGEYSKIFNIDYIRHELIYDSVAMKTIKKKIETMRKY